MEVTGVILTKIDGDTRGGAALSVRHITGKPIKFTGTGEKITDIETFHPDRMASRILGMGDMLTLIEKASQEYDEQKALEMAEPQFKKFEPIALANTKKVLEAFKECQVSDYHFTGTTGYGYNDVGREKLDEVFAYVFKGEKAIVRPHFVSGTHALATTLISLMGNGSKGTEFIYAVGAPYDTMQSVIGASREVRGSLVEKGFTYTEVPLKDNTYDVEAIANAVNDNTRVVVIQRSRGYSTREPLSIADIKIIVDAVKAKNSNTICFVDNCYGEFTEASRTFRSRC